MLQFNHLPSNWSLARKRGDESSHHLCCRVSVKTSLVSKVVWALVKQENTPYPESDVSSLPITANEDNRTTSPTSAEFVPPSKVCAALQPSPLSARRGSAQHDLLGHVSIIVKRFLQAHEVRVITLHQHRSHVLSASAEGGVSSFRAAHSWGLS